MGLHGGEGEAAQQADVDAAQVVAIDQKVVRIGARPFEQRFVETFEREPIFDFDHALDVSVHCLDDLGCVVLRLAR